MVSGREIPAPSSLCGSQAGSVIRGISKTTLDRTVRRGFRNSSNTPTIDAIAFLCLLHKTTGKIAILGVSSASGACRQRDTVDRYVSALRAFGFIVIVIYVGQFGLGSNYFPVGILKLLDEDRLAELIVIGQNTTAVLRWRGSSTASWAGGTADGTSTWCMVGLFIAIGSKSSSKCAASSKGATAAGSDMSKAMH